MPNLIFPNAIYDMFVPANVDCSSPCTSYQISKEGTYLLSQKVWQLYVLFKEISYNQKKQNV